MPNLKLISLKNNNGIELEILNFGATILSLKVPDRDKKLVNVILGLENHKQYTSEDYLKKGLYLGSTIGRYAGRISQGGFVLDKKQYQLYTDKNVHLHGGKHGFDRKIWTVDHIEKGREPSVTLSYYSKHLEEGYPGNLKVSVVYQLTESNTLNITYKAETDHTTHINLTNHAYFNLNGKGSILDHELHLNCKGYLEVDKQLIPTGVIKEVKNSTYDFLEASIIERDGFKGLDHTFVLNQQAVKASIYARATGILMTIKTNQPGMVVYTPQNIEDLKFKDAAVYGEYPAICFETQKFSDAPHNDHFPSTLVGSDAHYLNESVFEFTIH